MKTKLILLLIIISMSAYSRTGYWIVISHNRETKIVKTEKLVEVYTLLALYFPGNCIEVEKELDSGRWPLFEIRNGSTELYIEKREIDKKGNYKRIKTKNLKQWKKKN